MYELKTLQGEYPNVFQLQGYEIYISASPFANCQSFVIGNARQLLYIDDIKALFKKLNETTGKRQFVVDLVRNESEDVIFKLKPIMESEDHIDYTNTNGTTMTLYVIKIDLELL